MVSVDRRWPHVARIRVLPAASELRELRSQVGIIQLAPPACLAQSVEHVFVVFGTHPRDAAADINIVLPWGNSDRRLERRVRLLGATKLAQCGCYPAIVQREVRVCAHQTSRRCDAQFIVMVEIVRNDDLAARDLDARFARGKAFEHAYGLAAFSRVAAEDQAKAQDHVGTCAVGVDRQPLPRDPQEVKPEDAAQRTLRLQATSGWGGNSH